MKKEDKTNNGLVNVLTSEDIASLGKDYAELGIDAFLSDGILKDIPLVSTFLAAAKLGISVRDRILIKKIIDFLVPFQNVSTTKRRQMVERLEMDPDYGRKVGEHLLCILERIDGHKKPRMTSLVFKAYLENKIKANMLHLLINAIESLPAFEIDQVKSFLEMSDDERAQLNPILLQSLGNSGLSKVISGYGRLVYKPSEVCERFVEICLCDTKA